MRDSWTSEHVNALATAGFLRSPGPFATPEEAWRAARLLVGAAAGHDVDLEVLGDFVIPPADGPPSRDFQTLHIDFGLPLLPAVPGDVARFTALHLPADNRPSAAVTRLVLLRSLLAGKPWPDRDELLDRFLAYGTSHGAWDGVAGYVEGSLARIVEAALADPSLPSVKTHPEFLCGTEFASLDEERAFFAQRGLRLEVLETEVALRPGELLLLDNLALAHGRRGTRRPGELRQRVYGHRALPVQRQAELRDGALAAFANLVGR